MLSDFSGGKKFGGGQALGAEFGQNSDFSPTRFAGAAEAGDVVPRITRVCFRRLELALEMISGGRSRQDSAGPAVVLCTSFGSGSFG